METRYRITYSNDYERAARNILLAGSWIYHYHTGRLRRFGLTPEQYNVLWILRNAYPNTLRLTDIAAGMVDRKSNTTRLVEKLRFKGLLNREISKESRRQVDIGLNRKGMSLLEKIGRESDPSDLFQTISKRETKQLNRLLEKLKVAT